jgi:hypothetical protein
VCPVAEKEILENRESNQAVVRPGNENFSLGARARGANARAPLGGDPTILPNVGRSLSNDIFSVGLGLPTIWVPHSYPGCSQHAPNEHLPLSLAREALRLMAGLYWDLGEPGTPTTRGGDAR